MNALTNLNTGVTYPNTDQGVSDAYHDMEVLKSDSGISSCVVDGDYNEVLCNRWDH